MLGDCKNGGIIRNEIRGGENMENVTFTKREYGIIYDTLSLFMDMNPAQSNKDLEDYEEMNNILEKCFKVLEK